MKHLKGLYLNFKMTESTNGSNKIAAPGPASWFEFLLDSTYLEKHLLQQNPDPPATELITHFLANASPQMKEFNNVPPMIGGIGETKVEAMDTDQETKTNGVESKKIEALRLLALSVAAFLNWNLDILERKLPLPMQNNLLLDFLKVTFGNDPVGEVKQQLQLDFNELPDQALFSLHVYNRWIIRALLLESFPTKLPKIVNVQLPGQQIPSFVPPAAMEAVIKMLHETWPDSMHVLEKLSLLNRNIMIPTLRTFEIPTEMKQDVQHHWDSGILISSEELQCQLMYDLGCIHFFHEDFPKAGDMFFKVNELLPRIISPQYCQINKARFQGYLKACSGILQRNGNHNICPCLQEKVQHAIRNNYEGLVALLLEDNHKQEVSLAYRAFLEQSIQYESFNVPELKKLYNQVAACNIVKDVLSGTTVMSNYLQNLSPKSDEEIEVLIDIIQVSVGCSNSLQKTYLKNFLRFLVEYNNSQILPLVINTTNIAKLFTQEELDMLTSQKDHAMKSLTDIPKREYSGNTMLQIGELERDLLKNYNPIEVRQLIKKLYSFNARKPIWKINAMWELPKPLTNFVLNLQPGLLQDFTYIMIAKARELAKLKSFTEARHLFEVVQRDVAEVHMHSKLSRALRWEALLVDLLQVLANPEKSDIASPDLLKRCKMCITALLQDTEFLPRPEIIEHCAAYLLSIENWEYLSTNNNSCSSRLEFATVLAGACLEISNNNGSRKTVKELWELVLPMFSNNSQSKRSGGGMASIIQRESTQAIFSRQSLNQFMEKVHNPTVLSVLISGLAKLHNILKDDVNNNIFIEFAALWPSVVSNSGAFHVKSVCESLSGILSHALKCYPHHIPFLKTAADLNYVLGYHTRCLKYYLEAAILSSQFFSQSIPRPPFDDQVYRRMIRCCSQLSCHTEAAILCQFLDEIDYLTAFKSLQEKNCSDAMDAYYDCFWDITILEFLVNLHTKRGELDKKQLVLKVMGKLELNSNNNEEIKREAANIRKGNFMRALVEQFLK